ncbi:hypothetical protein [Pseudescherichia sp.]|uniref:hypothetical protein n=1 Tax=Pseudescherichia sp. TaxID=2055881 RepID=UPI0028A2C4CF|nr:hypothetical protein [Pseudescherichia sp.]
MKNALLVIDVQNDYFPGGAYPLEGAADAMQCEVKKEDEQSSSSFIQARDIRQGAQARGRPAAIRWG